MRAQEDTTYNGARLPKAHAKDKAVIVIAGYHRH